MDPLFGKNPFVLKGNKWKVVRGHVTSAITSGKIKQMSTFITNISKELIKYINKQLDTSCQDGLEVKELCSKYTTDVVAACAFGLDGRSFIDPNSEFKLMGQKIFRPNFWQAFKNFIIFVCPALTNIFKLRVTPLEVSDWFIGVLKQTIKYREDNNIVRNDYLDLMISLKSKPCEYVFTDMDVMAQAMTFYGDGMETSATTLSFALYEIAKNPEVQHKLRNEIDNILPKYNGEIVYEAIQEMEYLDMVISESLRKYPPAMFLMKVCTKTFTFPPPRGEGTGSSVTVNPGMSIIIPVYAIHHDPKFYPDPEKFDPTRFTDEEKKNRPKCSYIPFGEGPRMCLGFRFALTQIKIAIAATIFNFEVKVNPKTRPTMEIEPTAFILTKKGGMWLNFSKRIK